MPYVTITSVDGIQVNIPAKVVRNEHAWLETWQATNLIRLPGAFVAK